jgi:hypothetical protein
MGTDLEHREDRITLARVHGVLGAVSIGMIGAMVSANKITDELQNAVWWFGASILLNAFFYVLETDPYAPRYKSKFPSVVFALLSIFAIGTTLSGTGHVICHISRIAGLTFIDVGSLLFSYLIFVLARNRRLPLGAKLAAYCRETDDFVRRTEEVIRQSTEIKREFDEELQRQTSGEKAAGAALLLEINNRLQEKVAELKLMVAENTAALAMREAEVQRLQKQSVSYMPKVSQPAVGGPA